MHGTQRQTRAVPVVEAPVVQKNRGLPVGVEVPVVELPVVRKNARLPPVGAEVNLGPALESHPA